MAAMERASFVRRCASQSSSWDRLLSMLVPFTSEQAIHRRVGNLAIDDTAFAKEPFFREPQAVEEACRTFIPRIGVGFDAV
jgi:hypothetical protein